MCDITRSFCCQVENELKGSKARWEEVSLEDGTVTKEMTVACVRIDPVYIEEAGKHLIGKSERISDSADIYSGASPGLCPGKTENKGHIPNCPEVFG